MTEQSISSRVYRSKPWAIQVAAAADRIEYRMLALRADPQDSPLRKASEAAVTHHLEAARRACARPSKRRPGAVDWWRGSSVEGAHRNLHSAKISMVDVLPGPDVAALVPEVCTRLGAALDRNDPRRTEAEKAMQSSDPRVVRAALRQAMETSYDASDEEYVRLRDFRNIVLATDALLAIFTGILLWAVSSSPEAIPLCFSPTVTGGATTPGATGGTPQTTQVCPSGEQPRPTSGDILIIAGLGVVGGGVGAIVAIRNLRGSSTPYGVPMALAVLKVPSGALTAVIGMLLLAGGFIPGLSNLDSRPQILAYALVFGYAQQLITRLADNQAQAILNRLPSKDPESAHPVLATPTPSAVLGTEGQRGAGSGTPGTGEVPVDGTQVLTPNGSKPAATADNPTDSAGSAPVTTASESSTPPDPAAEARSASGLAVEGGSSVPGSDSPTAGAGGASDLAVEGGSSVPGSDSPTAGAGGAPDLGPGATSSGSGPGGPSGRTRRPDRRRPEE